MISGSTLSINFSLFLKLLKESINRDMVYFDGYSKKLSHRKTIKTSPL